MQRENVRKYASEIYPPDVASLRLSLHHTFSESR
jgi:hypothetical protein